MKVTQHGSVEGVANFVSPKWNPYRTSRNLIKWIAVLRSGAWRRSVTFDDECNGDVSAPG